MGYDLLLMHITGAYRADQSLVSALAPSEGDKDTTLIGGPSYGSKAFLRCRVPKIRPNKYHPTEKLFDLAN